MYVVLAPRVHARAHDHGSGRGDGDDVPVAAALAESVHRPRLPVSSGLQHAGLLSWLLVLECKHAGEV